MPNFNDPKNLFSLIGGIIVFTVGSIGLFLRLYIKKKKEKKQIKKEQPKIIQKTVINEIVFKTPDRIVKKSEFDKDQVYIKSPIRNYFESLPPLFLKRWRFKRKFKRKSFKYVIVRMNMLNNSVLEFFVPIDSEGFEFNKRRYLFDHNNKYFLSSSNIWCYDYHEAVAIPIRVKERLPVEVLEYLDKHEKALLKTANTKIDIEGIREVIEQSQISSVISSINPKTLREYLKSNFIQGLVQGAALGKVFRLILIIVIISTIVVVFDIFIDAYDSGLFDQIAEGLKKK